MFLVGELVASTSMGDKGRKAAGVPSVQGIGMHPKAHSGPSDKSVHVIGTTTNGDARRGSRLGFGITRVHGADLSSRALDPNTSVEDISQGQRTAEQGARVPEARRPPENSMALPLLPIPLREVVEDTVRLPD